MIIIPAIDIRQGKCVRLYQGDFSKPTKVAEDPVEVAEKFQETGAQYIHMVDLDGALEGRTVNEDIIINVVSRVKVPVELGGGIRDLRTIDRLINKGISRVILGSVALKNTQMVMEAVKEFGQHIAVGIDAKNGKVSIEGWLNTSNVNYIDFALKMEDIGVDNIIFTDISRDGTLKGPNLEQLQALKEKVSCKVTASGGIKDLEDIKALKAMELYGAITGKAIYDGTLSLAEALKV
ncbi:MAG: 1-(5-phosphoribosyl)-5-[(5-phosphoribosylamino)methylideneamino]imidazole-4-carboxamide isomerase [Clostridiales bacterium]|uniref:1-(5-phosphoribosyl)-5-[(5- phosphoribosylamino)methylideneamino]imidazole-4- carboxamide isomerase n=1 Tax=Clostridium sp. N3C TaxID=1776758 RepID=UPI00092E0BCC|nr:1-(5-phosphoribosyl)-5-[(5-phosphoribosylamino)methylideneamino]imidazole-4-carboxamide isomerase [Clostridium sp. N3C]NLZ48147.1 1-(5-phosphoribosyl)-5-[(5-phosphoribosylamino)methylideneamino]imidazole-4-carboxamide isomerase [Clostridiales bacterium]SCN22528.1 1-(5-phosphoribosyl)-5-[(5-phosphoribosylamino)methylideneamino] imidazole-4-carboxamide isomerase [Clostridium sp. N3C]